MNKDICRIAMLAFVCLSMPAIAAPPPPLLSPSKTDIPIKGDMNAQPNPGKPAPPPPPPPRDEQTCFAYSNTVNGPLAVRCQQRRELCEQEVRTKLINGKPPNIVVVLGCSRGQLYCFAYNGGRSSGCYADGNECVSNRNNFASQQGTGQVGACRAYTIGLVQQ